MYKKIMLWFFKKALPIYIPGRCKLYFLALWSAPMEPATLSDYWKALRITIRTHNNKKKIAKPLWVLKKGLV